MVKPKPLKNIKPEIEGVTYTSFSRLNEMLRCSWKYMLKYELNLRAPQNMVMARGSAGHHALEVNAKHKMVTGEDLSATEVLDRFNASFDAELLNVADEDKRYADRARAQTQESLYLYMLKYAPKIEPLAVELEFLVPIPTTSEHHEPVPPIKGMIDVVQKRKRRVGKYGPATERTELLDRKFPSGAASNASDRAELSDQLTLYDYVLTQSNQPTQDIGFEFHIPPTEVQPAKLKMGYRPQTSMTSEARETRHARMLFKMRQMQRIMKHGDYMPVDDPRVCSGCELRKLCQYSLAKDDYTAEKFSAESFNS